MNHKDNSGSKENGNEPQMGKRERRPTFRDALKRLENPEPLGVEKTLEEWLDG